MISDYKSDELPCRRIATAQQHVNHAESHLRRVEDVTLDQGLSRQELLCGTQG